MKKLMLLVIAACFLLQFSNGQTLWPAVKKEMHPWTRWWWMGSAVDEKNLDSLLTAYKNAGIGGVEITPIYGAKGYESRYIDFLSPKWIQMLNATVQKARSLGMGVDMNTGTGWPFGGPQITKELAATKLIIQAYPAEGGKPFSQKLVVTDTAQLKFAPPLQAVTAVSDNNERIALLDKVANGQQLNWTPPAGNWTIYAAFSGKTGQLVKRAAPGGQGYVMDHYSLTAVNTYLKRFTGALKGAQKVNGFFNDSYEVYLANWTPAFFQSFRQMKGYDLKMYLKELSEENTEMAARIKSDYNDVLGRLLLQDFTGPWTKWAHANGAKARNQAHGSPGNILDLYSVPDIPECEAYFGISRFMMPGLTYDTADVRENLEHNPAVFKFASSAAHFYGKPLTSSETFVWQTEHFRTALSRCKPEVEQLFLAGINHVFFHGSTYSPQDVPWPGWTFYASTNFVPANSTWPHVNGLTDYITRCQSVLQAGKADNEIMIYWPIYDQFNNAKGLDKRFTMHSVGEWLFPTPFNKLVKSLQGAGYSTDYVSDKMIHDAVQGKAKSAARVLVIPACEFMPDETLQDILKLAEQGFVVVFQQLPKDVPGYFDLDKRRAAFKALLSKAQKFLSPYVQDALEAANIHRETLTDLGLQYIRRDLGDGKHYYIVNHSSRPVDAYVPLNTTGNKALIMDPQDGMYGMAAADGKKIRLQMEPGEALIIRTYNTTTPVLPAWKYKQPGATQTINGEWSLHFTHGGPELPADKKLTELVSWTELNDPKAVAFSGSGVYTNSFTIPSLTADEYLLQLGKVNESARIWINGKEAGILWCFPFQTKIKKYLKPGVNTIKIEVANLMANRIRDMDQKKITWRNYHEINFVNIHYKSFDAANWSPLPSGLTGPVTITAINNDLNDWFEKKAWLNGWKVTPHGSINQQELEKQYNGNKAWWDKAFTFLRQTGLDTLRPGKYPIDGDNVFATVAEGPSKSFSASEWESHRNYIDLQYVIKGKEIIGVAPFSALTVREPYDTKRDVIFWNELMDGKYHEANPNTFFLFFPQDAHRPNILAEGHEIVKKIVVKIRNK